MQNHYLSALLVSVWLVAIGSTATAAPYTKACAKFAQVKFPAADRPTSQQARKLKGCNARQLYYGLGQTKNVVAARHCAFLDKSFQTSDVLMMVYANGLQVQRNLPLALRIACKQAQFPEIARAEATGRIDHLLKLFRAKNNTPFDFCDDITSGRMMGECYAIEAQRKADRRVARYNALGKRWHISRRRALKRLHKAATKFFEAVGDHEVDLSGTARAMMAMQEIDRRHEQLLKYLEGLDKRGRRQPYNYTAAQQKQFRMQVQSLFREIQRNRKADTLTHIDPAGIAKSQRAWVKYRRAFIAFRRARDPKASPHRWPAFINQRRVKDLEELAKTLPKK